MDSRNKLTKRHSILKELRTVTGTMRGLSAVNIGHFEKAALAVSEHDAVVDLGFQALSINGREELSRPIHHLKYNPRIIILFGTDHGLCGRFNERVIDRALAFEFPELDSSTQTLSSLLVVGQVAAEICSTRNLTPDKTFALPGTVEGIPELVRTLIIKIDEFMQISPNIHIDIFHHRTVKGAGIDVVHTSLLPINRFRTIMANAWPTHQLPSITLTTEKLLASLISEHIFIGLYRACAESCAAEHMSRLTSMQAACQNIDEQLSDVDRRLRQHRQTAITSELLDTVAGYEAIIGR